MRTRMRRCLTLMLRWARPPIAVSLDRQRALSLRAAALALLAVGLLAAAPSAQASWSYSSKWGSVGSGSGQFGVGPYETEDPAGVAVDQSTGDVYAVDQGNLRIEKFDASGNYLSSWGSPGPYADAEGWYGLAINQSTGDVYVADQNYGEGYWVFSSSGTLLSHVGGTGGTGVGQFTYTTGIAVDSSTGDVYVTDGTQVQKFDSSGNQLAQWGSRGTGNGQFADYPTGIAVDSSTHDVYVVDSANYRVEKFVRFVR
jgi:tripartite motif-containing protein 71